MLIDFQKKYGLVPGAFGPITAKKITEVFKIKHPAQFFGQVCHESLDLTIKEENLSYTASRLQEVFPKYFSTYSKAKGYERNPQKLGNLVYGNRMGNSNPNDGYYFRGRGAIQLTGRSNYKTFENWLVSKGYCKPNEIMLDPDLVWKEYYIESAIFFFDTNNLWNITDVLKLTKRVNGGTNGLQDRINRTLRYEKWF
ncbi:glycoside hydrolase family 19 protein [Empedobacter brevis]|uniref:Glycoside hydrolase family 19 protein n=1 Tax=Empedobacter brevis TaxID=247 RepID=A0AAJ1QGP2_9FLAO|nr:glycoside hydrolase family 19 protein [Empedobacter brevis]MDM1073695.1 glycoside hydrolase family 19 protein [Empedobacter brevis]